MTGNLRSHADLERWRTEVVKEALDAHNRMGTSADPSELNVCNSLYVDIQLLRVLDNPTWEIVYGRPGSGKTMLLRTLAEAQRAAIEDDDATLREAGVELEHAGILPIYINAGHALPVFIGDLNASDDEKALAYFAAFMQDFAKQLRRAVEGLPRGGLGVFNRGRSRRLDAVDRMIQELFDVLPNDTELPVYTDARRSKSGQTSGRRTWDASSGGGVHGQIGAGRAGADARAARERSNRRDVLESAQREVSGNIAIRYDGIADRVDRIMAKLQVSRLCLLIDDWSHLDRTGTSAIQPIFADYLKRAFKGAQSVTIKMAADRYETRLLSNLDGDQVGFGNELREAVNLSQALLGSKEELTTYFETILWLRMAKRSRLRDAFHETQSGVPEPSFIVSIFESREAFAELAAGAEGNARRFLEMFRSLYRRQSYLAMPRWTLDDARAGVAIVQDRAGNARNRTPGVELLEGSVKAVAVDALSRLVMTPPQETKRMRSALQELQDKELILSTRKVAGPAHSWLVSDGVWKEWHRAIELRHGAFAEGQTRLVSGSHPDELLVQDPWRSRRAR